MRKAEWSDTTEYMILRCEACGMMHIIHRSRARDGLRYRDCGRGPLIHMGYAMMIGEEAANITVKVNVDTKELDKVQRLVDEIDVPVTSMIKRLIAVKGAMGHETDC